MESNKNSNRIHPLMAAAAVSVMLVSLVGVAAITGVLPNSHSSSSPAEITASTESKTGSDDAAAAPAKSTAATNPAPAAKVAQAKPSYSRPVQTTPAPVARATPICYTCGRVESVRAVQSAAAPSGVGVVAGAVLGGVLGNQIGGGSGRKIATVAGAVGGGYAGNEIEKRTRTATTYEVRVRMEDGNVRTFPYNNQPPWGAGDRVRVEDGYLTGRG
jgi:outer membrane lipoprotein SlyB